MTCPEPKCDARAAVELVGAGTFRVHESINAGGIVWAEPDVGHLETLELVEVTCTAGHRFYGPAEILNGKA